MVFALLFSHPVISNSLRPHRCNTPGFPVLHHLLKCAQVHVHCIVMPFSHFIFWGNLLLLPSIFPSIRDFSNESAVCIRWPNYWSFNFSISPSNEYLGLISLKINWFDLLAVQGTLESSPASHFKGITSLAFCFLYSPALTTICDK